jgi:hypothetical protein
MAFITYTLYLPFIVVYLLGIAIVILIKELCHAWITMIIMVGAWGGHFQFIPNECAKKYKVQIIINNIVYNLFECK